MATGVRRAGVERGPQRPGVHVLDGLLLVEGPEGLDEDLDGGEGLGRELGRLLVETDTDTGQYTHFIFEPLNGGRQTRVTFSSEFPIVKGIMGLIQRLSMPSIVRKMYIKELHNLAEYAQTKAVVR